jgi:hypothetical protein
MYINQDNHEDWDQFVNFARFAYNSAKHETTGMSPFYLLHGFEPSFIIDTEISNQDHNFASAHYYQNYVLRKFQQARDLARQNTIKVQQDRADKSQPKKIKTFNVGDIVMYKRQYTPAGLSSKLVSSWIGPYIVTKCCSEHNVMIKLIDGQDQKEKTVNVRQIKKISSALGKTASNG